MRDPWRDNRHDKVFSRDVKDYTRVIGRSKDPLFMRQVLDMDTHHLYDTDDVDAKPLVDIFEEILRHATINGDAVTHTDVAKFRQMKSILVLNSLSDVIHKLASEMSSKCLTGMDGDTTALSLFQTVGNFHWDVKLALILAAFALNHGEFWLIDKVSSPNELVESISILRQTPVIIGDSVQLNHRFDALNKLIHLVIELTMCIIRFKELPSMYITSEVPAMARASTTFPTAAYWNVRGIIACAVEITSWRHKLLDWELSFIVEMINGQHEFLRKQLEECQGVIGERKEMYFKKLISELLTKHQIDNMEILKTLLNTRDYPLPLFDGVTKQRASLEVLRKRNVLLLISGLDISDDEMSLLVKIYTETSIQGSRKDALFHMVWVPIGDPYTDGMHTQFEKMKNNMPWYSINHPSNIDLTIKKCIEDMWHFKNKLIVVVLDSQGKELSPNAIHMMWIWGSTAFPFTTTREEALWRDATWGLEFLVSDMDKTILNWIREDKYIFLYGGDYDDEIELIKLGGFERATGSLKMVLVGKEKTKNNRPPWMDWADRHDRQYLAHCWTDTALKRYFWRRLESMLFSKIQLKHANDQDDVIMIQIKKLLSYEKDDGSWAMLCRGSQIITIGRGSIMLQTIHAFYKWEKDIPSKGFDLSFKDYHDYLYNAANECIRFEFPIVAAGAIDEGGMRCPECHRFMDKYLTLRCYHGNPPA